MSIKSKVFAAAATMTLIGGVGAVGASAAHAATPSAGPSAIDIFSRDFGTHAHPNFTLDTLRQGEKVGQPQILFRTANFDPALDYTISYQGLVSDFFTAGLVSAAVDLHYADDAAFEVQYDPYGVDSGLCSGVAATATAGEDVTLQPCGVSAKTLWIVDSADTIRGGYVPLINGSDTNFSQPYVLTYPGAAYPTDKPRPELYVTNLTGEEGANGQPIFGTVNSNQLFGADFGVES
ncbi:MAG TPA: hypothetical protein VHN16_01165 [Streptosporangiaceae bacterium]|nr:hypothetical protein [Streptosporangiaceae bacterium]